MHKVVLVQLPIPPFGIEPVRGNVPLAAGYLKLYAQRRGLDRSYDIEILPDDEANRCGDLALVEAILARDPWMAGFSCYLWNVERTLWVCERLKERRPDLLIILGGPEVTSDNDWVLRHPALDYAAIGEGEQTFAELLTALDDGDCVSRSIDGMYVAEPCSFSEACSRGSKQLAASPAFRRPLARLDDVSSPYLTRILDAADEQMLLLETIRGCVFKCKFCYYPKSYDDLYFLSEEKIRANLRHAADRGAREVVLLDPTLNQKRDFAAFLRLLAECNPDKQFTYFGELRAEGINREIAALLREANFTEVEIGLQSIDPLTMDLMDRKNNLKAFERGVRAMLDVGIRVKVDLIIGLPGDTVDSVRRGMDYLHKSGLYSEVQVFNLAVLPGTAFRHEAAELGLVFQDRPPYYVLQTPTLQFEQMYELMEEAQDVFETEFDPLPEPVLECEARNGEWGMRNGECDECERSGVTSIIIDLDQYSADDTSGEDACGASQCVDQFASRQAQAFTLWLRSSNFDAHRNQACAIVRRLLEHNPHTTLQVVLEPLGGLSHLSQATLEALWKTCMERPSYLDKFYAVLPGPVKGAKRIVIALRQQAADFVWLERLEQYASVIHFGPSLKFSRTAEIVSDPQRKKRLDIACSMEDANNLDTIADWTKHHNVVPE